MQYSDPLVNLFADEVESSVAFYTRRLGFVEVFRPPADGPASHVEQRLFSIVSRRPPSAEDVGGTA